MKKKKINYMFKINPIIYAFDRKNTIRFQYKQIHL